MLLVATAALFGEVQVSHFVAGAFFGEVQGNGFSIQSAPGVREK